MLADLLNNFLFIQFIGVIGLVFSIFAWSAKTRSDILLRQSAGGLASAVHYFLLSAFTGALMSCMVIARNLIFNQKNKHKWATNKAWLFLFMILLAIGGALSWQGWISILPVLGLMVGTFGMWQDDPWKLRFYIFIACIIWLPYTIVVQSYSGILSQLLTMISIIVTYFRFHDDKPKIEVLQ